MPVTLNAPVPQTNFIGLSPEERIAQIKDKKLREISFARVIPKKVLMISPEGVEEEVLRDNVRDMIRLRGYRIKDTTPPEISDQADDPKDEVNTSVTTDDNAKAALARQAELKAAMDTLDGLRTALKDLGVEPDMRWGLNRLKTELAKASVKKLEVSKD